MKIAFFTDTYYPQLNGVTISVENYARELRKKGHTVYIFAPKIEKHKPGDENITNLKAIKILSSEPAVYVPMPTSYRDYAKIFRLDLDIVHAHGNGAFSFLGYQVARMKAIPYVLTFHNLHTQYTHYIFNGKLIKPKMVEQGMKLFANLCDGIITPSEKMKNELMLYGVKKPIHIIPNFVELEQFEGSAKGFLRKKCAIPPSAPILLSVGRLGKEKNFSFIIDVFQKLAEKDSKTHLVIVGTGKERESLKRQAASYGLEKRVHFTGRIAKKYMPEVYADATIFTFASVSEVHPVAALEACAAGLPLVVANDAAYKNVVINKSNGFLVPLKTDAFVEKLTYLLENKTVRAAYGKKSYELIKENFPPERLTEMLLKTYNLTCEAYSAKHRRLQKINGAAMVRIKQTARVLDRFFNG